MEFSSSHKLENPYFIRLASHTNDISALHRIRIFYKSAKYSYFS